MMAAKDVFNWLRDLPFKMMSLLFLSFLGNSCAFSAFFGYLPSLIHYFGVKWEKVGYYQGSLLFIYLATYSISAFVSGKIIDKYGSRYLFLASSFIQSLILFFTAFTRNIEWLYANTVLMAMSTTRVVALTLVYEICNESNQPFIMTYAQSMPWNIGMFLGPTISGIMAFPVKQYPNVFSKSSALATFPIMLPCLFIGTMMLVTTLIGWCVLCPCTIRLRYNHIDNYIENIDISSQTYGTSDIGGISNIDDTADITVSKGSNVQGIECNVNEKDNENIQIESKDGNTNEISDVDIIDFNKN